MRRIRKGKSCKSASNAWMGSDGGGALSEDEVSDIMKNVADEVGGEGDLAKAMTEKCDENDADEGIEGHCCLEAEGGSFQDPSIRHFITSVG